MSDITAKMNSVFRSLDGGLFSTVTKADVGEGAGNLIEKGVDILAWADPFFPDPSIPESVKKVMIEAIEEGFPSHYSMPIGAKPLREAIAEKVFAKTGIDLDPSRNVIVTPGSDSGLLYAMMPFLEAGDEVMVIDPSYPNNFLDPQILNASVVAVPLDRENNYAFDIAEFEKRVTDRTKMVVITHPNNPTTTVFRRENLEELSRFIIAHDLILVCDQAFEDHIFDDIEFVSPCSLKGMWERTVTVCSISKGLGLSGFRIGYIYAHEKIMDKYYAAAVNVLGAAATITSIGAVAAIKETEYLDYLTGCHKKRRDLAYSIFSKIPKVKLRPSESGILTWLDVSELGTGDEIASYLLKEANVLVNDGSIYGEMGKGHIRIVTSVFKDDTKAQKVFTSIAEALRKKASGDDM
ncbi:MAG: pyridoxal phosphate-dependent aminotransferase [Sphaerochaetaceae bacterium]